MLPSRAAPRFIGKFEAAAFAATAIATIATLIALDGLGASIPEGLGIYAGFLAAVFILIVVPPPTSTVGNRTALIAPLLVGVLFAGLRANIGTDTFAYRAFFDGRHTRAVDPFRFEPFFVLFARAVRLVSDDSQIFLFAVALLSAVLLYLIANEMEEKRLFLLLYFSTFYISLQFNLLRTGLGVLLALYAYILASKRRAAFALPMVLAFGTHYSTIALVPPYVATRNLRLRHIAGLLLAAVATVIAGFSMLSDKWEAYSAEAKGDPTIGIGFLVCFALLVAIYRWQEPRWVRKYGLQLGLLLATQAGATFLPIVGRLSMILLFVAVSGVCTWRLQWRSKVAAYLLVAYGAYATLAFVAQSDEAMRSLIANEAGFDILYGDTRWLPYETCFAR